MPGGRDCFCFLLIGRRRILTRDPILSEPEVPLVGKFRFFRLEPSVIDSTVLETSSTNDVTIDACILDPFWIAEMFLECATRLMGLLLASVRLWSVVCGTIVVEAAILSLSISRTEVDDPAESSKLRASIGLFVGKRRIVKAGWTG